MTKQKFKRVFSNLGSLLFVSLVLLLSACNEDKKDDKSAEKKDERVPVEFEALARGPIEAIVQSSAYLEAEASVKVYSQTTNKVAKLLVEEGDQVSQGQVLLTLEDNTQKLAKAKAEARFAKAKRDLARNKDLFEKEFLSKEELNNATYELTQAELEYNEQETQLAYTIVKAPIAGTITSRVVSLGDLINPNQELFEIIDFKTIVARVYLPEKNLSALHLDQKARLFSQAKNQEAFSGHVKRISPVVDAKTGTVKVTVGVDDYRALRPGMYVDVSLVLSTQESALLIPKRALVYDNDQIFAFRINRSAERIVAERVVVNPMLSNETSMVPTEGFQEGDEIVVAGQTGLKDQAPIRILSEPDPEPKPETTQGTVKAQNQADRATEVAKR